jgi:IPT/TIG domain
MHGIQHSGLGKGMGTAMRAAAAVGGILLLAFTLLSITGCGGACDDPADPAVDQIQPSTAPRLSPDVTIKVTGRNFRSDTFVSINNAVRLNTTFVNAGELDAVVPASSLQNAATLQVRAATAYYCNISVGPAPINCNPCYKTSSAFAFTVTP